MKTLLSMVCCIFLVVGGQLLGQEVQNTLKRVAVTQCELPAEKNYIVLSTVRLLTRDSTYEDVSLSISDSTLVILSPFCEISMQNEEVILEYRTFPFSFDQSMALMDTSNMIHFSQGRADGYQLDLSNPAVSGALIDAKGLNYNGSFSRGFSVGNSQSLVLNSNFDLQMVGDLGNGLKVVAAISDDNIPIQPQGNTQVLQEFDRVFIEVSKDQHSVIAGDYTLQRPQSHFLNYYKKLKGLGGKTTFDLNEKTKITTQANVASSRGKFARQTLAINEGNQGPYRLQGNNNERFIIVLSGSEKVYYNGELIKRGLENDYIIDYNTADIIFSPNRLVSKETRVIVEFEYTDQNYFRTLYTIESNIQHKKYNLNVNFYSEQDSKNSTSQIDLDSMDYRILAESGDDRTQSYRSGIQAIAPNNLVSGVGYRLVSNPNFPSDPDQFILQFEPNNDSIEVVATFTEVGVNQGNYAINQEATVNGRVYEYVGLNQGSYSPIVQLIPPEQRRAFSLGGDYQVHKNIRLISEIALSDFDRNRLSPVDDQDNIGFAGMLGYETKFKLSDSTDWEVFHHSSIEVLENDYNVLNPYRNAEFARDWNTLSQFENEEILLNSTVGLKNKQAFSMQYDFSSYQIKELFNGVRHGGLVNVNTRGFNLSSKPSYTRSEDGDFIKKFYRPNINVSQAIKSLAGTRLGINYEGEINEIQQVGSDNLTESSYSFDYLKTFIKTNENNEVQAFLSYNKRIDRFSNGIEIIPSIDIDEIELGTDWAINKNANINLSFKGRDFKITEPTLVQGESDKKTILGNLGMNFNALKGGVISSTNYQLNSGQEPKLEFVFQQVENIQGNYVYIGPDTATVQNINDFRFDPTNPLASYIRIAIPNNEFIRTNNLILNQSLRLDVGKWIKADTIPLPKWKRFLSKFSSNSNVQFLNKSMDETGSSIDPFAFTTVDSTLVSYNALSTHAVFFNRLDPKYNLSYVYKNNGNRNNQINGYEERGLKENEFRIRWNVVNSLDLIFTGGWGTRQYDSELYDPRDFKIDFRKIQPELNLRFGTQMRFVLKYKYDTRQQQINDQESSKNHDITFEFNRREKNNSSFDFSMSLVNIAYDGEANSPIEYDILEGLKDGTNYLWRVSYTQRLANNIDLSLTYDGRKTGVAPAVHVGRVQAKASF